MKIITDWFELLECSRSELILQLEHHYKRGQKGSSIRRHIFTLLKRNDNWTLEELLELLEKLRPFVEGGRSSTVKPYVEKALEKCKHAEELDKVLAHMPASELFDNFERAVEISRNKDELAMLVRNHFLRYL